MNTNAQFSYQIILDMWNNELTHFETCFNKTHKLARGLIADTILNFSNNIYESRKFSLPLSRSEIANFINSSREQVCRVLSKFQKDQIIKLKGKELEILNMERLDKISKTG